jgi:hypothetical protein
VDIVDRLWPAAPVDAGRFRVVLQHLHQRRHLYHALDVFALDGLQHALR